MKVKLGLIEKALKDEILLYEDLVRCLKRERLCLIDIDIDELWNVSRKKESIVSDIDAVHERLTRPVGDILPESETDKKGSWFYQISPHIPSEFRERLRGLCRTIGRLKTETRTRSSENMRIIEDNIGFCDEMISQITQAGESQGTYNRHCYLSEKTGNNVLLHKEA